MFPKVQCNAMSVSKADIPPLRIHRHPANVDPLAPLKAPHVMRFRLFEVSGMVRLLIHHPSGVWKGFMVTMLRFRIRA